MRIAVCDDLPEERARLVPLVKEFFTAHGVAASLREYANGEALLDAFCPGAFDLIFLDIYMPGVGGLATARSLKAADPHCVFIFTTTSLEHGPEAFDLEAFHYLVKPIAKDKLFAVLDEWYDRLCQIRTLTLKCGRTSREIPARDILYVDVLGRSSTVHTATETVAISMSLAALEAELPAGAFIRPIRYCLVSLQHMQSVQEDGILLDNGETLPYARRERDSIKNELAAYRLRQLRGR